MQFSFRLWHSPHRPTHSQPWNGKRIYFGDTHIHSCLSWDATRDTDEQLSSVLEDYAGDFAVLSEHAEGPRVIPRFGQLRLVCNGVETEPSERNVVPLMKAAVDRWNGRSRSKPHPRFGEIRFVVFPGYEWAPEPECSVSLFDDKNSNDYTPGHVNYFFDGISGWSYGPDVWKPGTQNNTVAGCSIFGPYNGSRDFYDEFLGQMIHQRDDPDRDYRMLIQANHPAETSDKGGADDNVFKWGRYGGHQDNPCSGSSTEEDCDADSAQQQCEGDRTRYGVTGVEWYAEHEAALGSTGKHDGAFHSVSSSMSLSS